MSESNEEGSAPVTPTDSYHRLFPRLNEISSVKEFQRILPSLSASAIEQRDTFRVLLLAGEAVRWRQWQSAAQLYAHVMVMAFDHPWDQQTLVLHSNHVLLLSHRREGRLGSAADVALYAYRRLLAALRCEGIAGRQANDWMTNALHEISAHSSSRAKAIHAALQSIAPGNGAIEPGLRPHVGQAHAMIVRTAWRISDDANSSIGGSLNTTKQHLLWLCVGATFAILFGWLLRDSLRFPLSSEQFAGINWLGAALISWPILLILTWVFAFFEAKRTGTLQDIHPRHLLGQNRIKAGEIMPFARDWFFHIFQFVWVPLLGISLALMSHYEGLPKAAALVWSMPQSGSGQLPRFLQALGSTNTPELANAGSTVERLRMILSSDLVALAAAAIIAVIFMANQVRIQRERVLGDVNFYWWDRRVSKPEWTVRLGMVGVDTFLGIFLLFKIAAIALVAYQLVSTDQLKIIYFSPDGAGGMKFLMDIFKLMSWLVFLFGLFVIASVYLHWNLPEYRKTDAALLVVYLALVVLAMMPLLLLDGRLEMARDSLIMALPIPSGSLRPEAIGEAARMLRDINEIRNWGASAWSWDLLNSPMLPLAGQLLFAVGQFFVREGGGNRFSMTRWSTSG